MRTFTEEFAEALRDTQCYRCGYCCMKRTCFYGEYDKDRDCCAYLITDDPETGTYLCLKHDEIVAKEAGNPYPMFGWGCSSTLYNDVRDKVKRRMKGVLIDA